jgi:hypothetical protein
VRLTLVHLKQNATPCEGSQAPFVGRIYGKWSVQGKLILSLVRVDGRKRATDLYYAYGDKYISFNRRSSVWRSEFVC